MLQVKQEMIDQMQVKEQQRQLAYQQYLKEKEVADQSVQRLIQEDLQNIQLVNQKKDQQVKDMVLSKEEKYARDKRERELQEHENEMVRRYAQNQQQRNNELAAMKQQAEDIRDQIFRQLCEEEAERRAKAEYMENLRNELSTEQAELDTREKER